MEKQIMPPDLGRKPYKARELECYELINVFKPPEVVSAKCLLI